jgi:superfamily II DNA or RNA helicase
MKLRDYQQDALNKVKYDLINKQDVCCVLPCGAGKTILFAYMAQNHIKLSQNNRVWFIVHRKELIDQTLEKFEEIGIHSDRIEIHMVQTLANKIKKGKIDYKPTMLIADEAHHTCAKTWKTVIDYCDTAYKIGLTATPCRLDGQGLGSIFDKLEIGVSAKYLIENEFLSPYDYYAPKINVNFQEFKTKGSDYDNAQVTELFEKSKIYGNVVSEYLKLGKGKKSILYSPSIDFSIKICNEFKNYGINAVHFDGNTDKKERDRIVNDFKNGKIDILSNVDLIGEGFDVPDCECCLLLRPTKSVALYIQQSMRCMRYKPNKRATIIDYVGNVFRHDMPDSDREWTLEGKVKCQNASAEKDIVSRECQKCHRVYSGVGRFCPYCGNDNHKTRKQIEQEEQAELERITEIEKINKRREMGMARSFEQLVELGRQRGYKNPRYWAQQVWNSRQLNKLRR